MGGKVDKFAKYGDLTANSVVGRSHQQMAAMILQKARSGEIDTSQAFFFVWDLTFEDKNDVAIIPPAT
jgi:hypothetical protein